VLGDPAAGGELLEHGFVEPACRAVVDILVSSPLKLPTYEIETSASGLNQVTTANGTPAWRAASVTRPEP
jgi:hypothetical protein